MPETLPVASDFVIFPTEFPTKPPLQFPPSTLPDAEESDISPAESPTNPPTRSPEPDTSPVA